MSASMNRLNPPNIMELKKLINKEDFIESLRDKSNFVIREEIYNIYKILSPPHRIRDKQEGTYLQLPSTLEKSSNVFDYIQYLLDHHTLQFKTSLSRITRYYKDNDTSLETKNDLEQVEEHAKNIVEMYNKLTKTREPSTQDGGGQKVTFIRAGKKYTRKVSLNNNGTRVVKINGAMVHVSKLNLV